MCSTSSIPVRQRLAECVSCNYSLEGLGEARRCPECGLAFDKADCRVPGVSTVLLFTPLGCAWASLLPILLTVPVLLWLRLHAMAVVLVSIAVLMIAVFLWARREVSRMRQEIVGGPHLLLLRGELRVRHGIHNAFTTRWSGISHVSLRRELPGLWRLTFRLTSVLARPRFYFRSSRNEAHALLQDIQRRILEARR